MKTLFVMGGGGFAMEPENLALDRYILSLSGKARPKICFIGTASGDSEGYHQKFYDAYRTLDCEPSHLALFKPHTRDIESFIFSQDVIHVGGGNTRNLLTLWREWGLDGILRNAYEKGVVLTGMSAGMICWFEQVLTDSYGGALEAMPGLGWLPGSACPHYDGEAERKPTLQKLLNSGKMKPGIALDDGVGALYRDDRFVECVSSRPNARGFMLESATTVRELPTRYLGG